MGNHNSKEMTMSELWPITMKVDWTPLVQSLADILTSSHKGVAKLLDLWIGRSCATALRDRLLREAQNRADMHAVEGGTKRYEDGVLMDVVEDQYKPDIAEMMADKIRRGEVENLVKALEQTVRLLEQLPANCVSDASVSKTFFNRWHKEVELVDDEELRTIWARIMAHEVVQPGSISLRTMDVVRNLSSCEAHLFQRMIKGEIDGIIPVDGNGHPQYIKYAEALILQDAGLIFAQQSCQTFTLTYTNEQGEKGIVIMLREAGLVACVRQQKYSVNCYILTDAGKCLLRIAQGKRSLHDFIEIFTRLSSQTNKSVISLHTIHTMSQDKDMHISWSRLPLWTSSHEGKSESLHMPKK